MLGEPLLRLRLRAPRGTVSVPVLIEGGTHLRDSLDIARHADRMRTGASTLFPDAFEREVMRWNGLSEVIARAGRALLTPRLLASRESLIESFPPLIPKAVRGVSVPIAEQAVRYIATKYGVRDEEREQHRATLRAALAQVRDALGDEPYLVHAAGYTYADIAIACALQFVEPAEELAALGPATRAAWTDPVLAPEHGDVLAWRDRVVAEHFVRQKLG